MTRKTPHNGPPQDRPPHHKPNDSGRRPGQGPGQEPGAFDIVDAAGHAYRKIWEERRYLIRLALVPVFFKFISMVFVFVYGREAGMFTNTLIMVPAYFAEGWMLSHLVRLIFLGQYWPFTPSGQVERDMRLLEERARGITAGTLVYVLVQMVFALPGLAASEIQVDSDFQDRLQNDPLVMVALVAFLVFVVWAFRYVWLFVPAALNYSLIRFHRALGGFTVSFYLIGVWLICSVPGALVMMLSTVPVLTAGSETVPAMVQFLAVALQAVLEAGVVLLSGAGICYGLRDMFSRRRVAFKTDEANRDHPEDKEDRDM